MKLADLLGSPENDDLEERYLQNVDRNCWLISEKKEKGDESEEIYDAPDGIDFENHQKAALKVKRIE